MFCGRWLDLVEGDGVAECFELALEAAGAVLDGVPHALPVGSEVAIRDPVADDVVVGDQQVVADRADCLGFAAAAAELCVVSGEVGVLGADRCLRAFGQLVGEPARSADRTPRERTPPTRTASIDDRS